MKLSTKLKILLSIKLHQYRNHIAGVPITQGVTLLLAGLVLTIGLWQALIANTTESESTLLPINDRSFQLSINVQTAIDGNPGVQQVWMNDVQNLGLHWYSLEINWRDIEPQRDQYQWDSLDLALNTASDYGINVLASIGASPAWARPQGFNPYANTTDFTDFLTELLNRYPGQIHAIEIWDEPNLDRDWDTPNGLSAQDYVVLLRESYTTIKNINPNMIVISGSLAPTGGLVDNGIPRVIDDFVFLDAMIDAGFLNFVDCIGVHLVGYNVPPDERWDNLTPNSTATYRGPYDNPHHSWVFRSTLETYADKVALAGGDQPLCVTQFGWATVEDLNDETPLGYDFARDNSLQEQADYTAQAIQLMHDWGFVWIASVWNLNYAPQVGWNPDNRVTPYSLIGPNWTRRPVYFAVRDWALQQNNDR